MSTEIKNDAGVVKADNDVDTETRLAMILKKINELKIRTYPKIKNPIPPAPGTKTE